MTHLPIQVKSSLFVTCIIDQLYPEVGESTVRVLRNLGVDLDFPSEQTCCGQPAFNTGFWREARPLAKRFLDVFRGDRYIVVPSGSCASMVRVFYPQLFRDEPQLLELARSVAARVYELSEFIVDVLGVTDLGQRDRENPIPSRRKVTYHEACHLRREQGVSEQPRALIRSLPNLDLLEMEQAEVCCGFGGTFAIKYPDISGAMLQDKIDSIAASGADTLVACDSGCLMHLAGGMQKQGVNVRALHVAQLLDEGTRPQRT